MDGLLNKGERHIHNFKCCSDRFHAYYCLNSRVSLNTMNGGGLKTHSTNELVVAGG